MSERGERSHVGDYRDDKSFKNKNSDLRIPSEDSAVSSRLLTSLQQICGTRSFREWETTTYAHWTPYVRSVSSKVQINKVKTKRQTFRSVRPSLFIEQSRENPEKNPRVPGRVLLVSEYLVIPIHPRIVRIKRQCKGSGGTI